MNRASPRARSAVGSPVVALAAALVVTAGCAGRAPEPTTHTVGERTDVARLVAVFADAGLETRAFDATSLIIAEDGVQVVVFLEDGGRSLQGVMACPTCAEPARPEHVARWNRTRRFGRAYVDADGLPVLAGDLALDRTTTDHTVAAWGRLMLAMGRAFRDEVWWADG
ncbi:hypothetical protein GF314_10600 [bacterium]|nr:hypothetical protein [bacterium]